MHSDSSSSSPATGTSSMGSGGPNANSNPKSNVTHPQLKFYNQLNKKNMSNKELNQNASGNDTISNLIFIVIKAKINSQNSSAQCGFKSEKEARDYINRYSGDYYYSYYLESIPFHY
jgi:hypothetical protein